MSKASPFIMWKATYRYSAFFPILIRFLPSMLISNVLLYYHSNVRNIELPDINRSHRKVMATVSLLLFCLLCYFHCHCCHIFVVDKTILTIDQYQVVDLSSFSKIGFTCIFIVLRHQVIVDFIAYEEYVAPLLSFFWSSLLRAFDEKAV